MGNFSTFCDLTYGTVFIVNDSLGDYTTQIFFWRLPVVLHKAVAEVSE